MIAMSRTFAIINRGQFIIDVSKENPRAPHANREHYPDSGAASVHLIQHWGNIGALAGNEFVVSKY